MKIYKNGKLVDAEDATVSVFDHGLLYGDGVFEGIRVYDGVVFTLKEHIDRLYDSARAIALDMPMDPQEMIDAVLETCRVNEIDNGYVRLIVTRGPGTLGLNPYLCDDPSVIIIAAAIQLYPEELYESGLRIITAGTSRNHPEALNPRIKSLNYLNNIMAKIEALNAGVMECLLLNHQGYVAEGSGDNVFVVKGKTLLTPPSWCGALEGVTRNKVMELARESGYEVREQVLTRYDIYTADEVFLTGTAAEVISVVEVDKRKIGSGLPGPVQRELSKRFREIIPDCGIPLD